MKTSILAIAMATALISAPAIAKDDQTIMFEIGIGFGNASGGRTDGNDKAKFCKNRNTGRMVYGAIRYTYDNVEAHVARWFHDEEVANCDRVMWAVGGGYVISTEGKGNDGNNDVYASWTPGFAYVWGDNTDFTGKDRDGTNWRQTSNWQTFNRFAVGAGGQDGAVEAAAHRYGTFNPEHGEYFVTVGGMLRDGNGSGGDSDRGLTPPDGGDTIIINEGDIYNTNITVIDGNLGDGTGGNDFGTGDETPVTTPVDF